jgi:hypothetical protein
VPTLRAVRHARAGFDPRFFEKSPLFWPITPAARAFAQERDWPEVSAYARIFDGAAPVHFEPAVPRPRRHRRAAVDVAALYDARIVHDAAVPTRARSWHDFLNALVWGTFPRSKRVLHERQHEELVARVTPGAKRLPGERSRQHDAIALLDEGGVVVLEAPEEEVGVVFGHALYEGIVLGVRSMAARAVVAKVEAAPRALSGWVALADAALERRLAQALSPEALPRIALEKLPVPRVTAAGSPAPRPRRAPPSPSGRCGA